MLVIGTLAGTFRTLVLSELLFLPCYLWASSLVCVITATSSPPPGRVPEGMPATESPQTSTEPAGVCYLCVFLLQFLMPICSGGAGGGDKVLRKVAKE